MSEILIFFIILAAIAGAGTIFYFIFQKKSVIDKAQSESIRDLERRLTDLMTAQLKEIRGSVDGTSKAMHQQVSAFTKETVQIREEMKQVQEAMKGISSFQEFFRSPKIRGQWGEANLEYILSTYFPKNLYERQYLFKSGEQVDAVLKLPNGRLVPIDAKFSFDNFRKIIESEKEEEKAIFRKRFIEDAKARIQEISSKYILPSEGTVDIAVMYIPAEAVYYEMNMLKEADLSEYARSKKVILTSPNTIFLALQTIIHWFKDVQVSRQTDEILKRLSRIQQDAQKLAENFRKLGSHLKNALSSYDDSEKRVSLFSERVERLIDSSDIKPSLKGPEELNNQ
jgi:DNA recombination protein RmuC